MTLALLLLALLGSPAWPAEPSPPAVSTPTAPAPAAKPPAGEAKPSPKRARHALERLGEYEGEGLHPPAEPPGACPTREEATTRQKWFLERRGRAHGFYKDHLSKAPEMKKALVDALAGGKADRNLRLKTAAAEELVHTLDYYRARVRELDDALARECFSPPATAPPAAPETPALPEDGDAAR